MKNNAENERLAISIGIIKQKKERKKGDVLSGEFENPTECEHRT